MPNETMLPHSASATTNEVEIDCRRRITVGSRDIVNDSGSTSDLGVAVGGVARVVDKFVFDVHDAVALQGERCA